MNTPTAIVLAVVVLFMGLAIYRMTKKPACGCADESAGCGGCVGCGPVENAEPESGCGHEH